ncbi:MAG TPA: PorP/SprF family type IX secretion system membrane protein [Flavisolibacter sp.]|nr:PorP/SprF family type IX secretion system membrane protein [Flavisolibacter sp.]
MKRILYLFIVLLSATLSNAQQLHSSSFYDMHGTLHNPATAGSLRHGVLGGSFRTQWSGMPGSPQTGLVFGSTYLTKAKLGLGGYLYSDVTGPTKRTGLQMSYAYHIPMKNEASLSLGVEARVQQFSYDRAKLQGSLGGIDPVIAGDQRRLRGDAGFGVAYTAEDFQVGASVSQLVQSKLSLYEGAGNPSEEARLYRHYYFHGNYTWNIDGVTTVTPNLLFIYLPNAPLEAQGGARIEHNKLFWYGLSYRVRQAWMVSAGVRVKQKLNIGYSFDIYTSPLSVYDQGSNGHEIMLRYEFLK